MKRVLGLDLGTTSIGWALVDQATDPSEQSSIVKVGVRVNPLSTEEKDSFEKGKAITTNADRRLKRGMRRNLQRYKLRRDVLIKVLKQEGWIDDETLLSEDGPGSTFDTLRLRSKAATEEIGLTELARVLLNINKKRGYKSNRKATSSDTDNDGQLIDGMDVARTLYENGLTPGQYCFGLVKEGKRSFPDFYRSDLEREFDSVWSCQRAFYPEILTDEFKRQITTLGRAGVSRAFLSTYDLCPADNKGKDRKITALRWRDEALKGRLEKGILAFVIGDIRDAIQKSSGYLGAISDRSKELYFNKMTVGQYLYSQLLANPHFSTRNQVFYRQDYLDEFERVWEIQKKYHPQMTDALKAKIRDVVIFYQRPLKSQKGLVSFCEFESRDVEVEVDGKVKTKKRGCRVAPRSSLLFQEFKIWHNLNNLVICDRNNDESFALTVDQMEDLEKELTARYRMTSSEVLRFLGYKSRNYELNFKLVEGNSTMAALYESYLKIVELTGHDAIDASRSSFDDVDSYVRQVFELQGFATEMLVFDSDLPKEEFEKQPSFRLWHLLYSYEGDNSNTGDRKLIEKISQLCHMPEDYARIIAAVRFPEDYASLSHKAMRKILPYLKGGNRYDQACAYAGYNHAHSLTKEEMEHRALKDRLDILPKGALRNPVVEKIINQMINVVNQVSESYGKPDEIHIELARGLKQNQAERQKATEDIAARTKENDIITRILKEEFGLTAVTRSDILRYRLYDELKENGYKTLYSGQYIPKDLLFSKSIDIEHIIPQARLFDDSFANKTLEYRDVNIEKGRETARDYVAAKYGAEGYERFSSLVEDLCKREVISKKKRANLLMKGSDIPDDFLLRELTDSRYIARKSTEILQSFVRVVMPTTGSITKRLREDWQLVDVMKELNMPKFKSAGLTYIETRNGQETEKIMEWTKRNDHRHHAMDAIAIAFTRPSHIQILNHLKACSNKDNIFYQMRNREMERDRDGHLLFIPPIPLNRFRSEVKDALESTLVSIKAKNKVATKNQNRIKTASSILRQETLTPRGLLHKEQVYGKRLQYETFLVPVGSKLTSDLIEMVASASVRNALRARLVAFGGDSKKAFTGKNALSKNPLYADAAGRVFVPEKVKCVRFKTVFSIRKAISRDLKLDKVADARIRSLLQERLNAYGGDAQKAFSNLEERPIWLNETQGIKVKKVSIFENFDLDAIRDKRDKDGRLLLDGEGNMIPGDYVNLRNNHHISIYRDAEGVFQEVVVPFFEALQRVTLHQPVVDKSFHRDLGWEFQFSMKINEMFVFPNAETGFDPSLIDLRDPGNYREISPNLFRVQKLSSSYYCFRHHLETTLDDVPELRNITWRRVTNKADLAGIVKVRINHIGQIVVVGEYD